MLAGADAHAKLALRNADPGDSRYALPLPGYEASFRLLSVNVRTERPLSGQAADDAAMIMRAIRAGHLHTAIDGMATPPSLELTATNRSGAAQQGDALAPGGLVTLRVRTNAPAAFTTIVWDGVKIVGADHHEQDFILTMPGHRATYWVQVLPTGRNPDLAWVTSNAIYVGGTEGIPAGPQYPRAGTTEPLFAGESVSAWHVEQDPTSVAAVDLAPIVGGAALRFRFGLSNQITPTPYVALAVDTPHGIAGYDRLTFTIRAEQPMRVSVQLRARRESGAFERWQRSVYVAAAEEARTVFLDDFTPVGSAQQSKPRIAEIASVLFVVDPVNTRRGTSGRIWLKHVALGG
jgi:hypothetical protein